MSEKVKRYIGDMYFLEIVPDGPWVRYKDYARLEKQLEQFNKDYMELKEMTLNKNVHEEPEYYLCPWCDEKFPSFHLNSEPHVGGYKDRGIARAMFVSHYEACKKKFDEKQEKINAKTS